MAESSLLIRAYKNRDNSSNLTGTIDYWLFDTTISIVNPICIYSDISDKYDVEYVIKLYKKESKEPRTKLSSAPIEDEPVKIVKSTKPVKPVKKVAKKKSDKKKPAKEISKFFE